MVWGWWSLGFRLGGLRPRDVFCESALCGNKAGGGRGRTWRGAVVWWGGKLLNRSDGPITTRLELRAQAGWIKRASDTNGLSPQTF